ncbi:hypothetical protein SISNIDRAFT_467057 [Sistotremastrum niveocremeum HHB9708]|uniref:Alpha-type protein kinase domain-containing protein n=1 Tax=Sistotremastrum niveocremeum HHB9708 TaxID=1314777 RepID=A0A164TA75_9AGAM|nr:hypothetical protein SISNIDRAFT_467057 [Sistotremastrum niveocremeum HHB9708]
MSSHSHAHAHDPALYCAHCSRYFKAAKFHDRLCDFCHRIDKGASNPTDLEKWKKNQCPSCGMIVTTLIDPVCGPCTHANAPSGPPALQPSTQQHSVGDASVGPGFPNPVLAAPAGLARATASRTQSIIQDRHHAMSLSGNSISTIRLEFHSLAYLDKGAVEPPLPLKIGGFRTCAITFNSDERITTACNHLWTLGDGWQDTWDRISSIQINPLTDLKYMWVDGKVMLNARYFALHNGLPGLPLGLIFADANSAENKGYLIKPSNSKQYLCKLYVLIDAAQVLRRHHESLANTTSVLDNFSKPEVNAITSKRARSNTVTPSTYDPVIASPPRKRSTRATQLLQSPIRSPFTNTKHSSKPRWQSISFNLSFIVPHLQLYTIRTFEKIYEGKLTDRPFNTTGFTKDVYKLKVDNKMYVAKEFRKSFGFNKADQQSALEGESLRSWVQRLLIEDFIAFAAEMKVNVYQFHSANSFLIQLSRAANNVTPGLAQPSTSKSPSISTARTSSTVDPPRVFLCEPFIPETSTLRKFSGTMSAGTNNDLAGASADALAHFSYVATKGSIVLADLQGFMDTTRRTADNRPVCILFDNMAHFDYDTRLKMIGDGGKNGIDTFINQHVCGPKCIELGLNTLDPHTDDSKRPPTSISSLLTALDVILDSEGKFIEGQPGEGICDQLPDGLDISSESDSE